MDSRARRRAGAAALFLLCAAAGGAIVGCARPHGAYPLPPADDPHYRDQRITHDVLARLQRDSQLAPFDIHVQTVEAIVYLQGRVPGESLRRRAEQLARATPQVFAVRNNIAVGVPPR